MGKASTQPPTADAWLKHLLLQLVAGAATDIKAIPARPEAALHRLRVRMKKAGALLRLAKLVISKTKRKQMLGQMRQIKDSCAGPRDAAVIAKLAGELGKKSGLRYALPAGSKRIAPLPKMEKLRALLARLRRELKIETFDGLTWDDVKGEYESCYKAGRHALRKANKTEDAEDYHEWRKRVKTLYFQMSALHGSVPHLRKRMRRTHKLGHVLGRDHDLTLLEEKTGAQAPGSPWEKVIGKERKRLRSRILKLGGKVYRQSPRQFARLRRLLGE
jgi:CHAD domain-containing protein